MTDFDRRHSLTIASQEYVILNHGAMLSLSINHSAIEITGHKPASNIYSLADFGVTHIR